MRYLLELFKEELVQVNNIVVELLTNTDNFVLSCFEGKINKVI